MVWYRLSNYLVVVVSLVLSTSCAHRRPQNLSIVKEQVQKYHEGSEYHKDLRQSVRDAISHFRKVAVTDTTAVVFDIDSTVLSDYWVGKSIDFGYIPELSHEWIMQADAHAIDEGKELYDYLVQRGFRIIFLTGRNYQEYEATAKNLKEKGFGTYDKLIVRGADEKDLTAVAFKTAHRKKLTEQGYTIVGTVGDQWSDHDGGYTKYKVKFPNYRYLIP